MNLPSIHLEWDTHQGRRRIIPLPMMVAPPPGRPVSNPQKQIIPNPVQVPGVAVAEDSWLVSGGTVLPYMTPPQTVKTYVPPMRYSIPTPVSPLLALGFGLNLALLAADVLGVSRPGEQQTLGDSDLPVVY